MLIPRDSPLVRFLVVADMNYAPGQARPTQKNTDLCSARARARITHSVAAAEMIDVEQDV